MAREFGLDWKEYDGRRMMRFIKTMQWENALKANGGKKIKEKGALNHIR